MCYRPTVEAAFDVPGPDRKSWLRLFLRQFRRGVTFPHQMARFLEIPGRGLLLDPERLADRLELDGSSRVLEVGCGSGYYSAAVARRLTRGRLVATDLQPEMLDITREKLAGFADRCEFVQADARDLPFADASFDRVFMVAVLGEIPQPERCLRSCARVLRSDGVLSVSEHLPDPDFVRSRTLLEMATPCGFEHRTTTGRWFAYTMNLNRSDG